MLVEMKSFLQIGPGLLHPSSLGNIYIHHISRNPVSQRQQQQQRKAKNKNYSLFSVVPLASVSKTARDLIILLYHRSV